MREKLYRSNDRVIFGICQGFADHFDLSVIWIRLGLVAAFFLTGFFPVVILYFVSALIIKSRPVEEPKREDGFWDEDYFQSDTSSRTLSLRRLKNKFDSIESRIRRMENYVTNKSYDWERRLNADK